MALRSVAAAGGEAHIYRHVHPEGGGRGAKSAACLATVASRKMSVTYIACMHAYWQILGHDHTRALVLACRPLVDESEQVGEKTVHRSAVWKSDYGCRLVNCILTYQQLSEPGRWHLLQAVRKRSPALDCRPREAASSSGCRLSAEEKRNWVTWTQLAWAQSEPM